MQSRYLLLTNKLILWQVEIGSISAEIKSLQEKSMEMGMKLKNRKVGKSYFICRFVIVQVDMNMRNIQDIISWNRTWKS